VSFVTDPKGTKVILALRAESTLSFFAVGFCSFMIQPFKWRIRHVSAKYKLPGFDRVTENSVISEGGEALRPQETLYFVPYFVCPQPYLQVNGTHDES
jgi:hypothetical protein